MWYPDRYNVNAQLAAQQFGPLQAQGLAQGMIGSSSVLSAGSGIWMGAQLGSQLSSNLGQPKPQKPKRRWLGGRSAVSSIEDLQGEKQICELVRVIVLMVLCALSLWFGGCQVVRLHRDHLALTGGYEQAVVDGEVIWRLALRPVEPPVVKLPVYIAPVAQPPSQSAHRETGGAAPYQSNSQIRKSHLAATHAKLLAAGINLYDV